MSSMYVFTRKWGSPIHHVLLIVQNTHRRALLFIDNRQFIGFLHKQNWVASTDIYCHLLGLDKASSVAYNLGKTQTCNYFVLLTFNYFVLLFGRERLAKSSQACGKRRETLKSWNGPIFKYIQLAFCCVMEKLLIFVQHMSDYVKLRVE